MADVEDEIGSLESENRDLKAEVAELVKEVADLREWLEASESTLADKEAGAMETFDLWKFREAELITAHHAIKGLLESFREVDPSRLSRGQNSAIRFAKQVHARAVSAESEQDKLRAENERLRTAGNQVSKIEPLLILIEDVLAERRAEIEKSCEEKLAWQERHNADCHRTGEPRWHYMTEFSRNLVETRLVPLQAAVRDANQGYDALLELLRPKCSAAAAVKVTSYDKEAS